MRFDLQVSKRLGDVQIDCAFTSDAALTVLFGPSGAGKTSVLNMIAGLLAPDGGHVRVAGRTLFGNGIDVPVDRRRVGYVFQEPRLFPHLRVRDNLTYANEGQAIGDRLAFLGIDHLLDRWPMTLSGGEAKRVAIGRALLSDPAFLLLDEPLSSLDRARRDEIMRVVEHLRDVADMPILMVTHDPAEVARLAGNVIEMG